MGLTRMVCPSLTFIGSRICVRAKYYIKTLLLELRKFGFFGWISQDTDTTEARPVIDEFLHH